MKVHVPGTTLLGSGVTLFGRGLGRSVVPPRISPYIPAPTTSAGMNPYSTYPGYGPSYEFADATTGFNWTPWAAGVGGLVVGILVGKYVF